MHFSSTPAIYYLKVKNVPQTVTEICSGQKLPQQSAIKSKYNEQTLFKIVCNVFSISTTSVVYMYAFDLYL